MGVLSDEHRVRGRVWLLFALIAGAGSVYAHEGRERIEDRRALHAASRAITHVTPTATGGGPVAPEPYREPYVAAEPYVPAEEPPVEAAPIPLIEPIAPIALESPLAAAPVEVVAPAEPLPLALEEVESDPEPQAVATAADGGVLYQPPYPYVPYVLPVPNFPVAVDNTPFVQGPMGTTSVGAGGAGGAVTPGASMAGGTSVGIAGAAPVIGTPFVAPP